MPAKLPNRIASEDLTDCSTWLLPEINAEGNVLSSAEKERRDRLAREAEIIEDVEDEEVTYSPLTADQLQEISDAAEKEGFDKGYAEGLSKGNSEGEARAFEETTTRVQKEADERLTMQVSQLLQIGEALVDPIGAQSTQLQQLILRYVTSLTSQIIERELVEDSSHIVSVVKRALAALPVGVDTIKIMVNPDDLALVEAYGEEQDKQWAFRGDSSMQPGGCRIETTESLVDFSVESRVNAMLAQFLDKQLTGSQDDWDQSMANVDEAICADANTDADAQMRMTDPVTSADDLNENIQTDTDTDTDTEPVANAEPVTEAPDIAVDTKPDEDHNSGLVDPLSGDAIDDTEAVLSAAAGEPASAATTAELEPNIAQESEPEPEPESEPEPDSATECDSKSRLREDIDGNSDEQTVAATDANHGPEDGPA